MGGLAFHLASTVPRYMEGQPTHDGINSIGPRNGADYQRYGEQ